MKYFLYFCTFFFLSVNLLQADSVLVSRDTVNQELENKEDSKQKEDVLSNQGIKGAKEEMFVNIQPFKKATEKKLEPPSLADRAQEITTLVCKNAEKIWSGSKMYHISMEENLLELIRSFCSIQDVEVITSEKIEGKVNKKFENVTPFDFWTQIVRAYNLIYFYDGSVLNVYKNEEVKSSIFTVPPFQIRAILEIIAALNFSSSCFSIRVFDQAGLILVNGPPRAVDIIKELIEKVKLQIAESPQEMMTIQIFPLRYAWADDVTIAGTKISGIATVLRDILGIQKDSQQGTSDNKNTAQQKTITLDQEKGTAKIKGHNTILKEKQDNKDDNNNGELPSSGGFITIDARRNAVIVKDLRDKMPLYESLIKALDVPIDLIKIGAAFVQISTDANLDIGAQSVKWTKTGAGGHFEGTGVDNYVKQTSAGNTAAWAGIANIQNIKGAGCILNGTSFLANINALEKDNKAKTLNRPSILTVDNLEATITEATTYYFKTTAEYNTDMVSVSGGTTLKITPHIIKEEPYRKIRLSVTITESGPGEIGNSTANLALDDTTLTTQAILLENQSLLVGGLYTQTTSDNNTGVPILRNIPVLNFIFGHKVKTHQVVESLYLISPQIVELEQSMVDQSPFNVVFPKTVKEQGHGSAVLPEIPGFPTAKILKSEKK